MYFVVCCLRTFTSPLPWALFLLKSLSFIAVLLCLAFFHLPATLFLCCGFPAGFNSLYYLRSVSGDLFAQHFSAQVVGNGSDEGSNYVALMSF